MRSTTSTSSDPAWGAKPDVPAGVLIFDLDGTLIANDLTHELLFLCLRWHPLLLPLALFKLVMSRAAGKRWLVEKVGHHILPEHLPYSPTAIALIESHLEVGGTVELVSGSDHVLVDRIGAHLGYFEHVQGSEPPRNLVAEQKAAHITERHGDAFRYAGNSNQDVPVWKVSSGGFGFNAPARAFKLKRDDKSPIEIVKIQEGDGQLRSLIRAMRPHQWAKNLLIFMVPALVISQLVPADWLKILAGFFCLSFLASGTYLINDLFDVADDRAHATKKKRPIAAGVLSVPLASFASVVLIVGSLACAFLVNLTFRRNE